MLPPEKISYWVELGMNIRTLGVTLLLLSVMPTVVRTFEVGTTLEPLVTGS